MTQVESIQAVIEIVTHGADRPILAPGPSISLHTLAHPKVLSYKPNARYHVHRSGRTPKGAAAAMKIDQSVQIDAAPEAVFAFVTDTSNARRWDSSLEEMEVTSEGPLAEGSTVREVRKSMGWRSETTFQMNRFEPDRVMGWTTIEGKFASEGEITLEPQSGGTLLRMRMEASLPLLMKPMSLIMSPMINRQIRNDLATLKGLVETESTGSSDAAASDESSTGE